MRIFQFKQVLQLLLKKLIHLNLDFLKEKPFFIFTMYLNVKIINENNNVKKLTQNKKFRFAAFQHNFDIPSTNDQIYAELVAFSTPKQI